MIRNSQTTGEGRPLVLFVSPWKLDQLGGVVEVVANLVAQGARNAAVEIALFFPDYQQPVLKESVVEGVRTVTGRIASPWDHRRPFRSIATLPTTFLVNVIRLCRLLRRLRPAAVNVHFPSLSSLSLLLALRVACPGARLVLSFHGTDLDSPEEGHPWTRLLWRLLVRTADANTCCSDDLALRFMAILGRGSVGRPQTIHNGLDVARVDKELACGSFPRALDGRTYVLNVATFEPKKGQDVLVRAFAALSERHAATSLVLVGRTGELLPTVKQLVAELHLEERVVVLADLRHPDTLQVFARAHVFALSSRVEPFGIVLLEAAHFRVPIVATAVGGVPEIVDTGVHGLLVPPEDPGQLSDALSRLLTDTTLRQRLAAAAGERVDSVFTWHGAFARYMAVCGIEVDSDLQKT